MTGMDTVRVYQDKAGKWRWQRRAGNSEVISHGAGYTSKRDAQRAAQRANPDHGWTYDWSDLARPYCCKHSRCPGGRLCCCITENTKAFQLAWQEVHGDRYAGFDEDIALAFAHARHAARAEAWDEGFDKGERCYADATSPDHVCFTNPYRQEVDDE